MHLYMYFYCAYISVNSVVQFSDCLKMQWNIIKTTYDDNAGTEDHEQNTVAHGEQAGYRDLPIL